MSYEQFISPYKIKTLLEKIYKREVGAAGATSAVYHISIISFNPSKTENAVFLAQAYDVSSFGFFQRSSVKEFIKFFSRTLLQRTPPGRRQTVEHEDYFVNTYLRSDGLGACFVSTQGYNPRVAFVLLNKLLDEFHAQFRDEWGNVNVDSSMPFEPLSRAIADAQDPSKIDKITKIQQDLDDTVNIVHQTIDSVLDRGEKLDNLVQQSEDLSKQSQLFYNNAAAQNRCCTIM